MDEDSVRKWVLEMNGEGEITGENVGVAAREADDVVVA